MAPVKHRIFVSHSHLDNGFGTKLAQDLQRVLADEDAVFYYEAAFQEVLGALDLPKEPPPLDPKGSTSPTIDSSSILLQQMESAFVDHDWPDVIRKATYLIKHSSGNVSSTVYRLQGLALAEEGEVRQAQEALETALALVSDRGQRLTLLSDYTALLAQQAQWARVLQQSREALRLAPNDPGWLATQQQAQSKLTPKGAVAAPSQKNTPTTSQQPSPLPLKTKEQWLDEGSALYDLKRYEEAIAAYEQAIRLDPSFANAYNNKGKALAALKKSTEAQQAYEKAKQLGYSG